MMVAGMSAAAFLAPLAGMSAAAFLAPLAGVTPRAGGAGAGREGVEKYS